MKLNQIEWSQGCCGESYQFAEVQTSTGAWLRIKKVEADLYRVTQFSAAQQLVEAEREMTAAEVEALL